MRYHPRDIEKIYARIKRLAEKALQKGDFARALREYDRAAVVASNLNRFFKDDEIEDQLQALSARLVSKSTAAPKRDNCFVFYDHIGSNYVLALQYLRALMSWEAEILYILEPSRHSSSPPDFIKELKAYGKANIMILPERTEDKLEHLNQVYCSIQEFGAAKALIHAPAEGAFCCVLWNALDELQRYRIVPGDHHFYLGTRLSDYVIEFRDFGLALSHSRRAYKKEQLLCQPYYPIVNRAIPFEGFPPQVKADSIIVVSGGAMYKILGDGGRFLHLAKEILDYNKKVVMLYAGEGNTVKIKDFIRKHKLEDRFILLGQRRDIYPLIKNSDIYLGTYPFSGGLMTQLAVVCEKPLLLLSYFPAIRSADSLLNYGNKAQEPLSFYSVEAMLSYARQLIDDEAFRLKEGEKNRGRVISPQQFSESLRSLLNGETTIHFIPEMPEGLLERAEELYLETADRYTKAYELFLFQSYGIKTLWLFPKVFFKGMGSLSFIRRIVYTAVKRVTKKL